MAERPLDVDVVIAVHDPDRAIDRAVRSALASRAALRVTVVCHGLAAAEVADRLGPLARDPRVRLIEHHDGIPSPTGPFNAGLDAATARFTSIMGSDDELEPGAIDAWLQVADHDGAEVVIAPLRHAGGARIPTPPARPLRARGLHVVADRLHYRSAPLGLVSRARFGAARMMAGVRVGEDLDYSGRLWSSGARISLARRSPAYLVHDDAPTRVTFTPRPVADELAYLPRLLEAPWLVGSPLGERTAWAAKMWRINVFGALYYRSDHAWSRGDRHALAGLAHDLAAFAPDALERLSRLDRDLVDAAADESVPDDELNRRARARRRFASPGAVLTRRLRFTWAREAPIRYMLATLLASR
ncbi:MULTISPECIES: glycosyltransferase [unclassified Agromyces]|uniref:glycosyltransferase n=1 Tax=unclassified Agromyces TaxID=2639701 RepID=UPI003015664B